MIGDVDKNEVYCSYSIPSQAIDESKSVTYHERVFGSILSNLKIIHKPVNEAMAIIYSECAKEQFSGIALSFGAGMCNVCVSFRGIETLAFSTAKSGDWIDQNVAESLNIITNRVTSIKEKYLDLENGFLQESDKKRKRVLEALHYYYNSLIDYTVKKIIKEFEEKINIEVDTKIPIIISGGTSKPNGFLKLFQDTISKYELPFEISEIRMAKDPLNAVANGLLIKTMSDFK